MKKECEISVNEWMEKAKSIVGTERKLGFQTCGKCGEEAGQYEILSFVPHENPKFTYDFWKYEEEKTPTGLELGYYKIKFHNTKKYNGKEFSFLVVAYFSENMTDSLYISNVKLEDGKMLMAYKFGFVEV